MSKEIRQKPNELLEKLDDQGKSWAERNGAWIFLALAFGGIALLVLYEALSR